MNESTNRNRTVRFIVFLAVSLLCLGFVVACGSSGGGGGGGADPITQGVSAGEIEKLGSVFVNGVEFETEGAEVEIEGIENATEGDLQPGMIVVVDGSFNDDGGTATLISSEDVLEGPISDIASSSAPVKTLTIMGQTVIVEQGITQFDNTAGAVSFADLVLPGAQGMVVEVSGHPDAAGDIRATRIEKKADDLATFINDGNQLEIKGRVSAVTSATAFTLGGLTIDITEAIVDGTLAAGVLVEVKGAGFDPVSSSLIAATVEVEPGGLGRADVAKVHIEGFVADLTGSTFTINGQTVNFSAAVFRGGVAEDLVAGARVQAEGPIDAAGVLQAVKVTFKESVRFEGNIINPNDGSNTFTLEGLPAIIVTVDTTITRGAGALPTAVTGHEIKVRARPSGSGGTLMATRFEEIDQQSSDRLIIQAPVTAISDTVITLLGSVEVDTSQIANTSVDDSTGTESSNFEIEDREVSRTEFFSLLKVGDIVKARARIDLATGVMTWDEVEIEIED